MTLLASNTSGNADDDGRGLEVGVNVIQISQSDPSNPGMHARCQGCASMPKNKWREHLDSLHSILVEVDEQP
jgi:hypothetical protein